MSTLREDFERHMSECGRSVGSRYEQGFYIASQVEQMWQAYQAATERAAKVAEEVEVANDVAPCWQEVIAAAIRGGDGGGR